MHPIHDADLMLLLATTLAAKRKPAQLTEIVAAMDLLHGSVPSDAKLVEAFSRLGAHGLMEEAAGGFTLTAAAQKLMAGQPRRADVAEHIFSLKEKLAAYIPAPESHITIALNAEQVSAAIRAHRVAAQGAGRNLLMPVKSKETDNKRASPGRQPGLGGRKPSR
ncbi:MAG: hypothetical protein JWL63_780 [Rhodocyclales bacterium]|nr:hypothetical protein [Rhodocyclales bacterium]